jgi:hypothetical protein
MLKRILLLSVLFYSLFAGLCVGMLGHSVDETVLHAAHKPSNNECVGCVEVAVQQLGCCETHTLESDELLITLTRGNEYTDIVAVLPKTSFEQEAFELRNIYSFYKRDQYIDPHKQLSLPKIE